MVLSRLYELIEAVVRRFWQDNALQIASALTFTTLLSLVPVATVTLSLMSAFPVFTGMSNALEGWVFANLLPASASALEKYSQQFVENAGNLTAVGLFFLVVTSIMLLVTIEDAFNGIWRVNRSRPMLQRVLIYWALITIGPILVGASLSLSSWLLSASAGWTQHLPYVNITLIKCSAVALTSLALSLLYYAMPMRPVRVRDALIGGLFAGVVFELTKQGFGIYITRFPTYKMVYGAFAAVPVFLLWLYVSWLVVLVGAVLTAVLPEWRRRSPQGQLAPGSDFVYALQLLKALWQAQQRGTTVTVAALHGSLNASFERIESLLESMRVAGWVNRAAPAGWVLVRNPASIAVADVYRRYVFDPEMPALPADQAAQAEWATLARGYGSRIGGDAATSVAALFESSGREADVAAGAATRGGAAAASEAPAPGGGRAPAQG